MAKFKVGDVVASKHMGIIGLVAEVYGGAGDLVSDPAGDLKVWSWNGNRWEYDYWPSGRVELHPDQNCGILIDGGVRRGLGEYYGYQFAVCCLPIVGAPDTIVAGCRRWQSFKQMRLWYNSGGYSYDRKKRLASLKMADKLQKAYNAVRAKQLRGERVR